MRVRYANSVTGLTMLSGYIEDLKYQIAAIGGATTGTRRQAISVDLPG
jgi:hypothetical protein